MDSSKNKYAQLEKLMMLVLTGAALVFLIYLIAAGSGVVWLKVLCAIVDIPVCILTLAYLYLTNELRKPRSLWMTAAAAAILVCTLLSLILQFPCPRP